ncbi:MAG TPA: SMC family ATPase, partial [Mycobacteriales bacterium]|nr:SMC family ATPase [Mycobacteriales bacterium]
MRPHRLTLTAFGPFAGTAAVDFEPLADAGLFLLHGDTGAGKTTLLDGICYALFGTVPGQRAAANRLRSDHADPATASEVVLDTTIGGQRLRISRKPAWQRPKKRGSGTTEEKASVQLERMSANGWEMVSTRGDEVGRAIGDAIGMTSEQFLQVVLLPQGGFATFLQAKVEERAALLQKLFGTERFKDVERWLQDQRRTGERALSQGTHALDEAAAAIAQAAGIGTQELDGTEPDRTGPDSPG